MGAHESTLCPARTFIPSSLHFIRTTWINFLEHIHCIICNQVSGAWFSILTLKKQWWLEVCSVLKSTAKLLMAEAVLTSMCMHL